MLIHESKSESLVFFNEKPRKMLKDIITVELTKNPMNLEVFIYYSELLINERCYEEFLQFINTSPLNAVKVDEQTRSSFQESIFRLLVRLAMYTGWDEFISIRDRVFLNRDHLIFKSSLMLCEPWLEGSIQSLWNYFDQHRKLLLAAKNPKLSINSVDLEKVFDMLAFYLKDDFFPEKDSYILDYLLDSFTSTHQFPNFKEKSLDFQFRIFCKRKQLGHALICMDKILDLNMPPDAELLNKLSDLFSIYGLEESLEVMSKLNLENSTSLLKLLNECFKMSSVLN